MRPPPEVRWAAYADGVGHAFAKGPSGHRALCEVVRLEERWEHPIRERCAVCTDELNRLTKVALMAPEGEMRALWGNR